ncbi:TonB-dependent receptor [Algoriphagus mannitolivorans]|uniref:TonB-dependent receptor n=1 Tax=Algoriphagus mannitolivorans TaxID=226504 RepID=UPI0004032299|nr:TonB-dependent receptor [Algoriphagus mannitolivorans]
MNFRNLLLLFPFLLLLSSLTHAQTGTITGVVKDAETGETLPFCNVFINNTTVSTVTDMEGNYTLSGLEAGPVELGFSFMGYTAETKSVTLNPGGKLTVNMALKPFAQDLSDVEIKASRDKSWERDLRKFQNLFIGIDEAAAKTQILNPWVIDFPASTEKNAFIAKAEIPLEIENHYLGYKITFNLRDFYDSPTSFRIVGAARFEEMNPGSEIQKTTWEKNRADVYRKSPMNMFRALLNGAAEKEGFYLYGDKGGGSASMNMRSDIFANELGKSVVPYKAEPLVTPTSPPGTYFLNLKGRIEIHYQKGFAQANTYKDAPYPISWLEVNGGRVKIKDNGMVLNPQDVIFSGDMDRKRISNLLPLDYNAEKAIQLQDLAKTAKNYQEKVYLHTDKPYYYAGDQLYFKGYFRYGNPYLKDELSKILHVELISTDRDLILRKKFLIQDGIVVGDFNIPDSLNKDSYFLRAYTNWMRNYGPDSYFLQPLTILDPYKRIIPGEAVSTWKNQGISVETSPVNFGNREKVTLTIRVKDAKGNPAQARISAGVWDAEQIVPIQRTHEIHEGLSLQNIPESQGLDRFSYPIQTILSFPGMVSDDKGKGVGTEITAFVNDFEGMIQLESNLNGQFSLDGAEFYGPMKLAMSATDKKGKPLNVRLDQQLAAPIALPAGVKFPAVTTLAKPIREPEPIPVSKPVKDSTSVKSSAIYGEPDFVIPGEKLTKTGNTSDLVNSLAGQVPGMRVTTTGASGQQNIRIRGGAVSATGNMEPVVIVNGIIRIASGETTAADNLRTINPFDIDRVEVVNRMVSTLGDQGKNGVIAVYLKENLKPTLTDRPPGFQEFTIEGLQPSRNFFPVDYSQINEAVEKDDRQTLLWDPYLVTDEKGEVTISFYSNDSDGPVVVEIKGLTIDGEAVFGTFLLRKK